MTHLLSAFWADESGQDLIEYALMCGLVSVGVGVLMPTSVLVSMTRIYSKVNSLLERFESGGG